jgi:glycerol uptake facilitator-like aquaporin
MGHWKHHQAGWLVLYVHPCTAVGLLTEAFAALFQIGFAYACGILFAVTICSATSGGHFNPCITIVQMLFKGFPPLKGARSVLPLFLAQYSRVSARYIVSQIFGGYIACLLIYLQYRHTLLEIQDNLPPLVLAGIQFTPNGPAGIFGLYVLPGSNLGQVFVNEFVTVRIFCILHSVFTNTDHLSHTGLLPRHRHIWRR